MGTESLSRASGKWHYYDDPSLLIYDPRKELRPNVEHIIADNRARFLRLCTV